MPENSGTQNGDGVAAPSYARVEGPEGPSRVRERKFRCLREQRGQAPKAAAKLRVSRRSRTHRDPARLLFFDYCA